MLAWKFICGLRENKEQEPTLTRTSLLLTLNKFLVIDFEQVNGGWLCFWKLQIVFHWCKNLFFKLRKSWPSSKLLFYAQIKDCILFILRIIYTFYEQI